jgi:WG containing repeat
MKKIKFILFVIFINVIDANAQDIATKTIKNYNSFSRFNNGHAVVNTLEEGVFLYGLINKNGKEVVPCEFSFVQGINKLGNIILSINNKYGLKNKDGKLLIPFEYEYGYFQNGYPIFNNKLKNYIYHPNGDLLFHGEFKKVILIDSSSFVVVTLEDKYHFVDQNGKLLKVLNFKKDQITNYLGNGLFEYIENSLKGMIDLNGSIILNPKYLSIDPFKNGLAVCVAPNLNKGMIDRDGNVKIPFNYRYLGDAFSEELIEFKKAETNDFYQGWGFMDINQKLVLQIKKGKPDSFVNGLARVQLDIDKNCLLIDKLNKVHFKYRGDEYDEDMAQVKINGGSQFIDRKGNVILKTMLKKK